MNTKQRRAKALTLLASVLAGGTLFTTCESRVRDAFVDGSKLMLSQILGALTPDQDDILQALSDSSQSNIR